MTDVRRGARYPRSASGSSLGARRSRSSSAACGSSRNDAEHDATTAPSGAGDTGRDDGRSTRRSAIRPTATQRRHRQHDHDRHEPARCRACTRRSTRSCKGEQAYFSYINALGGVDVAGKKYKIKLVSKDDAYDAAKTSTQRRQSLINSDKVFALFNVVGTKNNLGIRETVNSDCVPDLADRVGRGAVGQHEVPVDARLRARAVPARDAGVRRLPEEEQAQRDDRAARTRTTTSASRTRSRSKQLVKGTSLKIVQDAELRRRGLRREGAGHRASPRRRPTRSCSAARCSRARPR